MISSITHDADLQDNLRSQYEVLRQYSSITLEDGSEARLFATSSQVDFFRALATRGFADEGSDNVNIVMDLDVMQSSEGFILPERPLIFWMFLDILAQWK